MPRHFSLVPTDHNVLRQQAPFLTRQEIVEECATLAASLDYVRRHETALGVAAPQTGVLRRVFVMDPELHGKKDGTVVACFNPEFEPIGSEEVVLTYGEGCLSVPGQRVQIPRARHIRAVWTDAAGKQRKAVLHDLAAIVFQHELDHLDGVLMIEHPRRDQVNDSTRRILR